MCKDCGCGLPGDVAIDGVPASEIEHELAHEHDGGHTHEDPHAHEHGRAHQHGHPHEHPSDRTRQASGTQHDHLIGTRRIVEFEHDVLEKNDRLAEVNRLRFGELGLFVLNILSSPGSGKTTLLERTAEVLGGGLRMGVVVGDLATENDAARLRAAGVPAVQITTGSVCHLDAGMVALAVSRLDLTALDVLVVENVGNLVCPAIYDLGERARVVLLSVTEGEDKPLKYPVVFSRADLVLITKSDISAAVEFDRATALANVRLAAPQAQIIELSARTGEGMMEWCAWLERMARGD